MLSWRKRSRAVLAIDYDPQFNLSQAFVNAKTYFKLEKDRKTVKAILQDDDSDVDPFAIQTPGNNEPPEPADLVHRVTSHRGGHLDVVVSTLDLMHLAIGQPVQSITAFEERFQKFIAIAQKQYDLIIIDCHPAGSILTKTSLQNSDHVLIPVVDSPFALRGVALMTKFVSAVAMIAGKPKSHILINNVRGSGSLFELNLRASYGTDCLSERLKHFKIFSDLAEGGTFVRQSKKPYSTKAYANLVGVSDEIISRLGL